MFLLHRKPVGTFFRGIIMTTKEMTNQIMMIHGQILFDREPKDYRELLVALEELRYFLRIELNVPPLEYDNIKHEEFTL